MPVKYKKKQKAGFPIVIETPSKIWSGQGAKKKDKFFQVSEPFILGLIDPYFE